MGQNNEQHHPQGYGAVASVPKLNTNTADPEVMVLHQNGTPAEEIVKHFRLSRTSRDDYVPEMVIQDHENGRVNTNCHRCYRLKKKCSRDYPNCQYCVKTNHDCFYIDRRKARFNYNSAYLSYQFNETNEIEKNSSIQQETAKAVGINPTSCTRCFRLKRKCSRTFPKCEHCFKTNNDCFYDKNKRYRALKFDQLVRAALDKDEDSSNLSIGEETVSVVASNYQFQEGQGPSNSLNEQGSGSSEPVSGSSEPVSISSQPVSIFDSEIVFKRIDSEHSSGGAPDPTINKIVKKSLRRASSQDEFVNLKCFDDPTLPNTFIDNFFYNYEYIYPIFNKEEINKELKSYNFSDEQIINSKLYLLLSIGCLLTDTISHEKRFSQYFNENIIDSIIDSVEFNSFDNDNFGLLILLSIYHVNRKNFLVTWNLVGIIIRLVIKYDLYRECSPALISIYNLDKDLSSILNKPSSFPQDNHCNLVSEVPLVNKFHELYKLENRINQFKLDISAGSVSNNSKRLALSNDVETWRVSVTGLLHLNFHSTSLQEFTTLINLNYYYLCIELDELSDVKSSQFILQFLSQYFALILSDKQKNSIGVSLNNLLYFEKLIKVIRYNLNNLKRVNAVGYIENFQLIVNLLKYLNNETDLKRLIDLCTVLNEGIRAPGSDFDGKLEGVICELECVSLV